ncbi:signal peptidase I [Candidatus Puniceispirillum sp.]|nr:signal peptidase I [Candidatus Puniceispirillum sp.]
MSKKRKESKFELLKTILVAGVVALGFRSLLFEPFNIPSGSMVPSLLVGDYLFVSKSSYGYSRYSFPFGVAPFSGRVFAEEPKRGDVAVFRQPTDPAVAFIKRVIGTPGDQIQVKNGILHINGVPVKRSYLGLATATNGFTTINYKVYEETLSNGSRHLIQERSDDDAFDNTAVYLVPDDHYFMMGDNRDNSRDSRTPSVGMVPAENLVGRADRLFFSHNGNARIWEVWKWPFAIRYGRIGDSII